MFIKSLLPRQVCPVRYPINNNHSRSSIPIMNTYSVQLLSVLRASGLINPSRRRCGPTRRVLLSLSLLDREGRGVPQLSGFFTGGIGRSRTGVQTLWAPQRMVASFCFALHLNMCWGQEVGGDRRGHRTPVMAVTRDSPFSPLQTAQAAAFSFC